MSDTSEKVISDIRKGKARSAYLLYGEEEFSVSRALDALVDVLVPEQDRALNLVMLDGAECAWEEVVGHLKYRVTGMKELQNALKKRTM